MIHAEVSIYPLATKTPSVSFYIAKAIETIQNVEGIKYEINSMGTSFESDSLEIINKVIHQMTEAVHNLGIDRVEVVVKIDSRRDKNQKMSEKIESVKKFLN